MIREQAVSGDESISIHQGFFGAVSDGSAAIRDVRLAADPCVNLPQIARYPWGGSSILLESRAQSIVSAGQGVLLVGQLFNPAELAERLGLESPDPPAVLLHAYRKWGTEFPNHLHGEFSFVLWDGQMRRILLGRDASGYSPVFYTQFSDNFAFATDLRLLHARLGLQLRPDESWIANWLTLLLTAHTNTVFAGICSLRPGQMLLFEHGRVVLNYFWRPEETPILHLKDAREYADGLREVLQSAVQQRLPRDCPAGSHLSGGLDSSSITALAARILEKEGRRIFAFTAVPEHAVAVPGRFCDEGPHAAALTEMYRNVDHVVVPNCGHSAFSMMDWASSAECQPIGNTPNYAWIYEINAQARLRGVRTLLTGAAGNMTISYDGLEALSTLAMEGQLIKAARVARNLHRRGVFRWRGIAYRLLRPWLPASVRHLVYQYKGQALTWYSPIRPAFARAHGMGTLSRDQLFHRLDSRAYRLQVLRGTDQGQSFAAFRKITGVSISDPTLDPQVVSYCFSVPVEYFCDGMPRSLIRNAMAGLLPDRVRLERDRGLQAADFGFQFRTERHVALAEFNRMKEVDLAARALDLESIGQMMQWSEARITQFGEPLYWAKLMRAFSLGRFLRRLEDGTLFACATDEAQLTAAN